MKIVFKTFKLVWLLHEKGYVHGDLKPENIIVEVKENQLKKFYDVTLIDF